MTENTATITRDDLLKSAKAMYELIQQWRTTGVMPSYADITTAHYRLGKALSRVRDKRGK